MDRFPIRMKCISENSGILFRRYIYRDIITGSGYISFKTGLDSVNVGSGGNLKKIRQYWEALFNFSPKVFGNRQGVSENNSRQKFTFSYKTH